MAIKINKLSTTLYKVYQSDFEHPSMSAVIKAMSTLSSIQQDYIVSNTLSTTMNFDEMVDVIHKKFFILRQKDHEGDYYALGFGSQCVSVATWSGDQEVDFDDIDVTYNCEDEFSLSCHSYKLESFIKFWMEYYGDDFQSFLMGLEVSDQ